jgi:hypothetical protein
MVSEQLANWQFAVSLPAPLVSSVVPLPFVSPAPLVSFVVPLVSSVVPLVSFVVPLPFVSPAAHVAFVVPPLFVSAVLLVVVWPLLYAAQPASFAALLVSAYVVPPGALIQQVVGVVSGHVNFVQLGEVSVDYVWQCGENSEQEDVPLDFASCADVVERQE